jgi:Cu(I)/Ag(I) efflux system membrane fusion protein
MRRPSWVLAVLAVVSAAGIGGLWLGHQGLGGSIAFGEPQTTAQAPSDPVIYYQDPDGRPLYSAEPTLTPDGRPYRAVRAGEDLRFDPLPNAASEAARSQGAKKIRYYRNPMGLPDISPTPKKDSMGMDYIAVYEGDDEDGSSVRMTPAKCSASG